MYSTLRNSSLEKNPVLERGIETNSFWENVSEKFLRFCFPFADYSPRVDITRFWGISPSKRYHQFYCTYLHLHMIKTITHFQKPKVYFTFNRISNGFLYIINMTIVLISTFNIHCRKDSRRRYF